MKKLFLFTLLFSAVSFAQKPIFASAKVKAATVYYNSAELLQATTLNLPVGTSEIVIKNVANELNESTIKIGAPNSVTILSIQFTDDYVSEYEIDENNPAIKKVRDSIIFVQKEIKKIQIDIYSHQQTITLLDNHQSAGGTNNRINVAELSKLVDYYKTKRTELDNTVVTLQEKEIKWNKKLKALNDKLVIDTQKEDKTSEGKLIIHVMNEIAGTVNLDINYITNSAKWKPFYDLRANNITSGIDMKYKAQVSQWSGLDWEKVKLTLSNGNPSQSNQAPVLSSWFLRYGNLDRDDDKNTVLNSIQGRTAGVIAENGYKNKETDRVVIRGSSSLQDKTPTLIVIDNQIASTFALQQLPQESIKSINVIKGPQGAALYGSQGASDVLIITTKDMNDYTSINENQLNVSFDINIPYSILSNNKVHSVALKEIKLPATYKYYAAPKAEKEAFLLAEIADYSKYNLLSGEANIIFEGMYVGKTNINPNQTSDTLNLSMGRDKKINIKREKVVDKSGIKFLSSFKEQTFTYDLTVRNNKKETAEIILKDQYPISTDKEITVELIDDGNAKVNQETGILTWQIKLPSNETKKIRIRYKVKYPKDKFINNF